MGQRSAAEDDLVTCPSCQKRDHLRIRWHPELDHRVHERTDVGCARCDLWRTAEGDRWAFAEWNDWACAEWAKLERPIPLAELYHLLRIEAHHQKAAQAADEAVTQYLSEQIASRCAWKIGDRFEALNSPRGKWSVRGVKAVYGTNTGPFCILECCSVSASGKLGDNTREFWDSNAGLERLPSFWKPAKWSQVVKGDACILAGRPGRIVTSNPGQRKAIIAAEGEEKEVTRLADLAVPVERIEQDADSPNGDAVEP